MTEAKRRPLYFYSRTKPNTATANSRMLSPAPLLALVTLISAASAAPPLSARQSVDTSAHCGQWDTVAAGGYELLLDQWGISGASGAQCAHIASLAGATVAWSTNWTWAGGSGVKTFTDMQLNTGIGKQLSAISSMPVSASVPSPWWS